MGLRTESSLDSCVVIQPGRGRGDAGAVIEWSRLGELLPSPETSSRYLPLGAPTAATTWLPVPYATTWHLLDLLREDLTSYRSLVFALPPLWQLGSIAYRTCRTLGLPFAAGHFHDIAATADIARLLKPSITVVAEHALLELQKQGGVDRFSGSLAIGVRLVDNTAPFIHHEGVTSIELLPGYTLAHTCLSARGTFSWHLSEMYVWLRDAEGRAVVVLEGGVHARHGGVQLPLTLEQKKTCACGRISFDLHPIS